MAKVKHQNGEISPGKRVSGQANELLSALPHALNVEQFTSEVCTRQELGLTAAEAATRLEKFGPNEINQGEGVSITKILVRQIANAMILVLIIAMVVSLAIKSWIEGGVITAVVTLNIVVGFFQEYSAEKTMDSLRSLSSPTATVIRDGNTEVLPTARLVYGDLVEVKVGDTVPADIRLIEAMNLEIDEALLTGESLSAAKDANLVLDDKTGPGDRLNVIFSSSTVTKGRGRGLVFATGMETEIGSIAAALHEGGKIMRPVKHNADGTTSPSRYLQAWALTSGDFIGHFLGVNVGTPLQRKLSKLAILLFGVAIICAIIVLGANKFSNNTEVIIYAVATGLSMIPASLIVVLTITMAAGTKRMVKRNVLVRKLDSLESLGAVTDICSDKTGTLTQGKMVVKKAWIPSRGTYSVTLTDSPIDPTVGDLLHESSAPSQAFQDGAEREAKPRSASELLQNNHQLEEYLNVASLANLAHVHKVDGEWKAMGDPTEIACQVFALRFNWNRTCLTSGEHPQWNQSAEYPFDSSIKKMSVIFRLNSEKGPSAKVFTKGAVERVLESCKTVLWEEDAPEVELTNVLRGEILRNMESLAAQGLRVLALASRDWSIESSDSVPERGEVEQDLVFQGLIGLYDPPRAESADAVKKCQRSGIAVHMLTGDHRSTASAIAVQVGILPSNMRNISKEVADAMVMTASQFDKFSDEEIDKLALLPLVIARCSPTTKVRMIEALHRRSCFVAMTGDGVNDSPSLKRADVGIAMGLAGSDVAKDASDIVLSDDNFASILNAIEEGRRMFDNIQKFILHLLAENIGQACTLLVGLAFKDQTQLSIFPLSPVEILWVIMITSGMPDMGLGFEEAAPDIMARLPHSLKQGVFTPEIMIDMLVYGLWMAALCLSAFSIVLFGFGNGDLATGCNESYSPECDTVFRARATTFVCLTWFALFLAWEMVNMRRSFFRMKPGSKNYFTQWARDVWGNQFLFWAIVAGFVTVFPTLYLPVINHDVFKHEGISWEWGIVFVEAILFFAGVEAWKWAKRVWFRRQVGKNHENGDLEGVGLAFERYLARNTSQSGGTDVGDTGSETH